MALTLYNIKKWTKMITGKSISHVNQGIGKIYNKNKVLGYYNDLTEKVTRRNLGIDELPKQKMPDNTENFFSIEIFQYGLGAYDLYLLTKEKEYLKRFKNCVNWAINNQDENGGWKTFECKNPYSSMAQGEGISLLVRAYIELNDKKYLENIKKAWNFMIKSYQEGGTTLYDKEEGIIFMEKPCNPVILNGWIFSIFGVYDYMLISDDKNIKIVYNKTIKTLKNSIKDYDLGYWSKYDCEKRIASPFYHKLHSKQLYVLAELSGEEIFKDYAIRFENYEKNIFYKTKAFIIKAIQKIKEK